MIVFLVGMPRSGTKLLRDLLNRHTDIAIFPNESHFIPRLYRRYGTRNDLVDPRIFTNVFAELAETTFFRRLQDRGIRLYADDWRSRMAGGGFSDLLRGLFATYRAHTGATIVGDKTPEYITQIPLLASLLPEARFVHIIRDPRDYALSIHKAWGKSIPRAVYRWKVHISKYCDNTANLAVPEITVRYEDLLASPTKVLSCICEFLGVQFQPQMTSLETSSEQLGDAKGLSSVLTNNTQKWIRGLSRRDLEQVDYIAGILMAEFGYQPTTVAGNGNLSYPARIYYRAHDAVNLLKYRYRQEGTFYGAIRESWRAYRHSGTDE